MRRLISYALVAFIAVGLLVGAPASASASPSDVTVTNSVTCGMSGVSSIINNTAGDLNIISETIQFPSGHVNFPDPFIVHSGADGGGSWEFASTEGDIGFRWVVMNADTNEPYYTQDYAFNCDKVSVDLTTSFCGTSGYFTIVNGYNAPKSIYYTVQGNGDGHAPFVSDPVFIGLVQQRVDWSIVPQPGDTSFTLTVKNVSDDTVVGTTSFSISCVSVTASAIFCQNGAHKMTVGADATLESADRSFVLKVNGVAAFGPVVVPHGNIYNSSFSPQGLVPGTTYTVDAFVDGIATPLDILGVPSGTVPDCTPPSFTSLPRVLGSARVGQVLTCDAAGTTLSPPLRTTYEWRRNGITILYSDSNTIKLSPVTVNQNVGCVVYLSDARGEDAVQAASTTVKVLPGLAPRATVLPKVVGKARVGKKLTANVGRWSPAGKSTYLYQWYAGKKAIRKATKASWLVTKAYRGKLISVRIVVKRAGYLNGVAQSRSVKIR